MTLSTAAFWLPKDGNTLEEYEDAFDYSLIEYRLAIADGATESSFAERWARSLAQKFVDSLPSPSLLSDCGLRKWLEPLQRDWYESIDWEHLPWFSEEKAREGAFSSFLGLNIVESESSQSPDISETVCEAFWHWYAVAVGDSCLFQVRDDTMITAFPIRSANQFDNRPFLLSSNPASNKGVWDHIKRNQGDCQIGDSFILTTDALAQWILTEHESELKPWVQLCRLKTNKDFVNFIADLRRTDSLRNDDVTLLVAHLGCMVPQS